MIRFATNASNNRVDRSMIALLAVTLLSLGLSEADAQTRFANRGAGSNRTNNVIPTRADLATHGLERLWFSQASFDPTSDKLKSITVDERNAYVVSERGHVTAFNAESGRRLWTIRLGDDAAPVLEPVSNQSQILFPVGMSIIALDKLNGNEQWQLVLDGQPSATAAVDDTNVYVGTLDGSVLAYNLRKVQQLFNDAKLPDYSYNALTWRYQAPGDLSSPPITTGTIVEFASRNGVFTAVSASDRQLQYLFETDGEIIAPVTRTEKYVLIPSTDRNVYCVNSQNGQVRWTFACGLPVLDPATVVSDKVFVSANTLGIFQVGLSDGKRRWQQLRAKLFLASTPTSVYATDRLGNLLVLNVSDGSVRSLLPLRFFKHAVSNSRTDRIFLATSTGQVIALRERGREFPLYHQSPDLRPLLPEFVAEKAMAQ